MLIDIINKLLLNIGMNTQNPQSPIQRAVAAVGSQAALARAIGISPPAVSQWIKDGRIPPSRVREVARISGVPAAELAPDLYG